MKMRPSRVLSQLRAGRVATCIKLNLADARVAEIAALSGFDCVWLDLEHVPNTLHDIENQIRAAKAYDVDAIVRVARGSYSDIIHPLEMDAAGIMVPHLMNVEEAKRIAWQTRFHPIGRRALDGGNADGKYCLIDVEQYTQEANEQRMVIVQIEDPEPLASLDEIAAVPGIDMLFFGPGDFSQGLGATGKFDDPRIADARRKIAIAAKKHGKFAGTVASPKCVEQYIDEGYQFLSLGADIIALSSYFQSMTSSLAKASGPKAGGIYAAR